MKQLIRLALVMALHSGCGDTCGDAESECLDAHTIHVCSGSVDAIGQSRHWSTMVCPARNPDCVTRGAAANASAYDRNNRALCASASSRSAACAAKPEGFCSNNDIVSCVDGYEVLGAACAMMMTCHDGMSSPGLTCPVCAEMPPVRDARCDVKGTISVCVGQAITNCECGFHTDPVATCDPGKLCVDAPPSSAKVNSDGRAFCALSDQPDPHCQGINALYCDGDTAVACNQYGYPISRTKCANGCDPARAMCR